MSVEQLAAVLHHSRAKGTDKLVLIGIANHAGDGGAWPAVATLARYANVHERNVQRSITRLVELGELTRYVQAGGLPGWADSTRPNRYDVTVECPEWCDRSAQHKPRQGWAYDDAGQVVPVEHLPALSTGDTPEVQKRATRRIDPVAQMPPGGAGATPPVAQASPKPSPNQPGTDQVAASTTDRARDDVDDVDLSTVRDRLREATEQHDRRERGIDR